MLILAQTTDSIEVVLGGAPVSQLPCLVSYRDVTVTDYTPGRTVVTTNGTTPVAIVPAPVASTQRVVDFINIFNPNAANAVVTIRYNLNTVLFSLQVVTLAQNERLCYQEGVGWLVYTSAGAVKNSLNQGTNSVSTGSSRAVLGADVINNNAVANSIADVTGLSFPVVTGQRYAFKFFINYTAAATTTGSRWTIQGPSFSQLSYKSQYALTTASETFNTGLGAYDLPAASNASSAATTQNISVIEGIIVPSADGAVIARFASEIASSAITAKAGSYVDFSTV